MPALGVLEGGPYLRVNKHVPVDAESEFTVDAAFKSFGPVLPRSAKLANPLPDRGHGVQTDGSVCLAIYARHAG